VGEVEASPAGEDKAAISFSKETSNEAAERSLEAHLGTWEEGDLSSPLLKAIAPIDVDLKIITLEGPKLKLGQSASRFDIVKFGLSSEVEVKFADLGVVGLKLDWIDLEYEKDEYEAKLINVEIKAGVHHEFKDVDLGELGKWDVDATFTPTLEVEPNWKGVLARGARSIEEIAERLSAELLTVEALGVAVEFMVVAGSIGVCVLAFVQAADTTGYEAAHLDKRTSEVHDRMVEGFIQALTSENPDDFPDKGTPEWVGFDAGRRYRADYVTAVRAVLSPEFSESTQNEEARLNRAVYDLLSDRLSQIKPDAYDLLRQPAGEFVFRAFGEKHKPTFLRNLTGSSSTITILQGAWASCFEGKSPRGSKAKEMLKEYCPDSEASTIEEIIPGD